MATNNIYVDLVAYSEKDWETLVPTVFTVGTTSSGSKTILNTVDIGTTSSGLSDIETEAFLDPTFVWASFDIPTNFSLVSGTSSSENNVIVTFDVVSSGTLNDGEKNIITSTQLGDLSFLGSDDIPVVFSVPLTTQFFGYNIPVEFKIYLGSIYYTNDVFVDVTIADTVDFSMIADVFSTAVTLSYLDADVEIEIGRIVSINSDLFACASGISRPIFSDTWSTSQGTDGYLADVDVASGTLTQIYTDINSSVMTSGTIPCDIRTWSLNVGDFFLGLEEHTSASSTAWVDITDGLYTIDTTNSYFLVDGVRVTVTFSGIQDGYRMLYDPSNDFYSRGGAVYTAHAENTIGDVIENDYQLLYGYDVDFTGLVDWGYNKTIAVWATAKNLAHCSNVEADAFYFKTKDLWATNLGASITPIGYVNLGATLYPQGKVFYYGGTYTITVSGVRDFYGNEMEQQSFTFTVEDPTN